MPPFPVRYIIKVLSILHYHDEMLSMPFKNVELVPLLIILKMRTSRKLKHHLTLQILTWKGSHGNWRTSCCHISIYLWNKWNDYIILKGFFKNDKQIGLNNLFNIFLWHVSYTLDYYQVSIQSNLNDKLPCLSKSFYHIYREKFHVLLLSLSNYNPEPTHKSSSSRQHTFHDIYI